MGRPVRLVAPLDPAEAIERLLACLPKPLRLLVAISGGSDSTGLLVALHEAVGGHSTKARIVAVTVDHALRPESADEARAVASLCDRLGISHVVRRWNGDKPQTGVAAAARTARYELLFDVAKETGAGAILTGHTFEDQLETIAMRGARTGGVHGVGAAGMASSTLLHRHIPVLRPFLATRREAIRDLLRQRDIGWCDDPTNIDRRSERARLRQDLPPVGLDDATRHLRAWETAAEARRGLSAAAAKLADAGLSFQHGVIARLDHAVLMDDPAVAIHLVGTLIAVIGGRVHLPSRRTAQSIEQFLTTGQTGRMTAGRVVMEHRKDALYLVREDRDLPTLSLRPGETTVWDGRFRIANDGDVTLAIGPMPVPVQTDGKGAGREATVAELINAGHPPRACHLAGRSLPCVTGGTAGASNRLVPLLSRNDFGLTVERVLLLFDQFLPEFDQSLANSLAALAELPSFPPSPFNVFG